MYSYHEMTTKHTISAEESMFKQKQIFKKDGRMNRGVFGCSVFVWRDAVLLFESHSSLSFFQFNCQEEDM